MKHITVEICLSYTEQLRTGFLYLEIFSIKNDILNEISKPNLSTIFILQYGSITRNSFNSSSLPCNTILC